MQSGNLKLDTVTRKGFLDDEELPISDTEFGLLLALMQQKGQTVTRQWLLENVVGGENLHPVDQNMHWLRGKIEQDLSAPRITIVRGVGYRFDG
jgi:two-component system, OmpR family, response regulator RegX3